MIYISLTTVPDRMQFRESFEQTLLALTNQDTSEVYKIVLNVPLKYNNYETADIPTWLNEFIQTHQHKFTLLRDERDYGPITNLLYPLKHVVMHDDDIIIVVDDDHVYAPDLISYHLKMLQKYPKQHAICFRGNQPMDLRWWYDESGKKLGRFYSTHVHFPVNHDTYLRLPDHWHSVSYQRKFFHDDIFDEEFLSMTWNNDLLMGWYAHQHDFYFICPMYENCQDFRAVNYDGHPANSWPIIKMLPFESNSGCNIYRSTDRAESIWDTSSKFREGMKEKDIFEIGF